MKKIVFATGNQDKMREIREIMADCDVEIVSMKEEGISVDIDENGETFEDIAADYPALTTDDLEAIREALNL